MTNTTLDHATTLLHAILEQMHAPNGTCRQCSRPSRGAGPCAACLAGELDTLLHVTTGPARLGTTYLKACRNQQNIVDCILQAAATIDTDKVIQ